MVCPLLGSCKEKVSLEKYRDFCSNVTAAKYKECPTYQKEASITRTPGEWARLLTGMA